MNGRAAGSARAGARPNVRESGVGRLSGRYRRWRHVHGFRELQFEDQGDRRVEDSVHAARPQRRRPRRSRALRGTVGHPQHQARDHGGDQRDPGTQGRHGGLRDDRGLPRYPLHPAGQPAQPLRHHLDQAEAAGQAAALLRGQREDHGRRHGPRAARRGRGPHHLRSRSGRTAPSRRWPSTSCSHT